MNRFFNMIPGNDACCILLYGDIGEHEDVRSGDIARELIEAEAAYKKIDVRINSNGGDVYAGIAIFNAFRNSKADITIYVDGVAASMASVIALCGKPVKMSKYARLMLHSVSGGCYGNKTELRRCLEEVEALENTLCQMYAPKLGISEEEIRARYFDDTDHWLKADEALALGFIDGIYDAEPVPEDSTPEQIYRTFNNRLKEQPQNHNQMNLEEVKKRPRFKDCATDADVFRIMDQLEAEAGKVPSLTTEVEDLRKKNKVFEDKAKEDDEAAKKKLLDDAEGDGRINAETRAIYKNLLDSDRENGEKALKNLKPKKRVTTDLHIAPGGSESPWDKRMNEIRDNYNRK